ncbi:EAL domain-containing protein [Glaciecola sp. MH2013]|uniref:putative bifunctional diguanylate cyclase/phosphodiesterase n=1 Tax=Glaciecola sp. MH2013 TaxID=2785524 RepID=UPI0018A0DA73|nr:bifunctional diguanylate cyclase/phosphodiesterase [Glaciecola sp. MH2013]MBF7074175.1 EAL domain-containing protein [Glaciecola sp. MH2013]
MTQELYQFVPFYFSATIGLNALCAAILLASSLNQNRPHFKSLCVGCFVGIFYQYSTWQFHDSKDIETALEWLSIQTSTVILVLPLYVIIFLQWSRQSYSSKWIIAFTILSAVFFTINVMSPYTLRFSDNVEMVRYILFSGEEVTRLTGTRSIFIVMFQFYAIGTLTVLIWVAAGLIKKKKFLLSSFLILTLIAQVAVALSSIFVDKGMIEMIYLGGVPVTILNFIACVTVATSLEIKTKSLKLQIGKREELESVFASLAEGVSGGDSDQFYVNSMVQLQKLSQADLAYLCIYNKKQEEDIVKTRVVLFDGQMVDNFSYPVEMVPTELMDSDDIIIVKQDLAQQYPHLTLFTKLNASGFISAPMLNEEGQLEGAIVLLFKRALKDDPTFTKILEIFRARTGAELKRDRLEKQMHQQAFFDYQTGLPNRFRLHELINKSYDQSKLDNTESALIVFDLKNFTDVNRQYGFENAELALQALGKRLKAYSNNNIQACRAGGNKFAIIISSMSSQVDGMIDVHWQAIHALVKQPIKLDSRTVTLDCRGGLVVFPMQIQANIEVIRCAEIALNQAKRENVESLCRFDASILEEIDRKTKIESLLAQAIKNEVELFAVYQPKVDANGKLIGAEALCRWISDEVGFVSPDEFIASAERSGLIDKLGMWMVRTVCKQIVHWQDKGFIIPSRIAINVSAIQLIADDFVEKLVAEVKSHNVKPKQIEIELTESGLLTNIEDCIVKLQKLRDAGFTVALDDFGTGYSSLSYLKDLPLDVLKIDRSFVNSLNTENSAELARAIITIGKHMSMDIVAEGVEELEQVDMLTGMGCNIFQGYYFAKPMKSDELLEWAQAENAST